MEVSRMFCANTECGFDSGIYIDDMQLIAERVAQLKKDVARKRALPVRGREPKEPKVVIPNIDRWQIFVHEISNHRLEMVVKSPKGHKFATTAGRGSSHFSLLSCFKTELEKRK